MARERYLIDAGEDTIHSNVIRAETPKDKRKNWWYYHKVHLAICLIAAAIIFSVIYSVVSKVKPDYTIALMTSYSMPQTGVEELERCISAYADDRNGDGKVVISVMNYVFSDSVPIDSDQYSRQQANLTKFVADITMNDSMIILHDEVAFSQFVEDFDAFFLYNDGTDMPTGAIDFSNAMCSWSELSAFAQFKPVPDEESAFTSEDLSDLYGKLRVSFRAKSGTSIEKKEKDIAYWEDSLKLYDSLKAGTPKGTQQ